MIDFNGKNILMFSPYGATKHYGEAIKDELLNLKSATPFPKCYLHKEKWTFDS